jgi:hypothetical protein
MSITIGQYSFEGPYTDAAHLRRQSGVYAILGRSREADRWSVVDVGEAADIQGRVANHDRAPCWRGQGHRVLTAAAYYCPEVPRMQIECELRRQFGPPCGDR